MGISVSPILLGLLSALLGAVANLLARTVTRFARAKDYVSLNFGLFFLLMAPFALFFFHFVPSKLSLGLLAVILLLDAVGNYLYFRAFELLDTATASTLLAVSPLFSLVLLPFFAAIEWAQARTLDPVIALGILLTVAGMILLQRLSGSRNQSSDGQSFYHWLSPLGAALLFGASIYPTQILLTSGAADPFSLYFIRSGALALIFILTLRPSFGWLTLPRLGISIFRSGIVILEWLLLLTALLAANAAVVKTLADCYPLFVLPLAAMIYHEKISLAKAAGILIVVGGLLMISIS